MRRSTAFSTNRSEKNGKQFRQIGKLPPSQVLLHAYCQQRSEKAEPKIGADRLKNRKTP